MFESLTQSFQKIFKNLRGYGKLTERNVQDALREVRLALLEADVNFKVVKDFVTRIREQCMGEDVLDSVTPGQQVIKRVHDEMAELLGGTHKDFEMTGSPMSVLLLGLHGAGKTTTAGKLAARWKKAGKSVLLAACDIRRPAAVEQLSIIADQVGVPVVTPQKGETVPAVGARAQRQATADDVDILIFDTGGRLQIDDNLVEEVRELREDVNPHNVVLVLDAAIGQEAVHVAETFNERVGLTGLILTKLDGDARGGAALSVQAVTGCPILLTGTGERMQDLDPFYPERMASRILGMGDVVSRAEKAEEIVDRDEMARMEERLRRNTFDLEDFLQQIRQMKKLGPMEDLLDMLPAGVNVPAGAKDQFSAVSGDQFTKTEAVILSMTPAERQHPDTIDGSRRKRIAHGSGTQVRDVNELLKQFTQAKKMAKHMKKAQKRLRRMPI